MDNQESFDFIETEYDLPEPQTRYYLSIKTVDGSKHFMVPEEVYIYVRQLEIGVKEITNILKRLHNISSVL